MWGGYPVAIGQYTWRRCDEKNRNVSENGHRITGRLAADQSSVCDAGRSRGRRNTDLGGDDRYARFNDTPTGNEFIQVDAGLDYSLALTEDGSIFEWGMCAGECNDTPTGNGFTQIAAGWSHNLALTENGSIVAWGGWDRYGACSDTPTGNEFIQASAGYAHNLALTEDGMIVAWGGWDRDGQCSDTPTGNGFTQVSAGYAHSLALTEDGTIVAWGGGDLGETVHRGGAHRKRVYPNLSRRVPQSGTHGRRHHCCMGGSRRVL